MTSSGFHFSEEALGRIFSFESSSSDRLISRENSRLEFKESFNLGSADEYAKTAAAFANTQGGYIVFGVKDSPRQVLGLKSTNFETFDAARLTVALNERFAPEIHWESYIHTERGHKIGLIFFSEATQKPAVCTKNSGCLQQGAIYYRYRGRSEAIRYPELRRILDEERARERDLWMKQLRKISDVGVENVALLNLKSGEVSGANGRFYVSEDLLPKLQFIREGHFVEDEGAPALRLLGDLQASEGPVIQATVQMPTPIREPQIIEAFTNRGTVLSPTEYLKAICFEQSYFFPIYFFIQQTTESIEGTIDLLKGLDVRGKVRDKLIERLQKPDEKLTIGTLIGTSPTAIERRAIVEQIQTKSLSADVLDEQPMRFFEAITHVNTTEFDQDYIFNVMNQVVLPKFQKMGALERTCFRKALCHLDLVWYKRLL
jgi:Putative DNA-binding domain